MEGELVSLLLFWSLLLLSAAICERKAVGRWIGTRVVIPAVEWGIARYQRWREWRTDRNWVRRQTQW